MQQRFFLAQNMFEESEDKGENNRLGLFSDNLELEQEQDLFEEFFKIIDPQFEGNMSFQSKTDGNSDYDSAPKKNQQTGFKSEQKFEKQIEPLGEHDQKNSNSTKNRPPAFKNHSYKDLDSSFEQEQSFSESPFIPSFNAQNSAETKNIPKNFGRGIVSFILSNQQLINKVLNTTDRKKTLDFKEKLSKLKKNIKTIRGLRQMWIGEKNEFAREIRILSQVFLRKHCLPYIFNSRIKNHGLNIKYRSVILKNLKDPKNFNHLKQY